MFEVFQERWVWLYYCYDYDNFLMSYPGDFFEPQWTGTPSKRMIFMDVKEFKRRWKKRPHIRLLDKKFCKLEELNPPGEGK
jgi:hypothetical protein